MAAHGAYEWYLVSGRACCRAVKRADAVSRAFIEIVIKKIQVDEKRMRAMLEEES